jgi:hypothetical protein
VCVCVCVCLCVCVYVCVRLLLFGSLSHVAPVYNLSDNKDKNSVNSASERGTALESGRQRFG